MDMSQYLKDKRATELAVKVGIVVALFIVALLVVVYPIYSSVADYGKRIQDIRGKLEEQKVLAPAYAKLAAMNTRLPKGKLPAPKLKRISRMDAFKVPADIERAAKAAKMEPLDVAVDNMSIRSGGKEALINAVFGGSPKQIRALYLELAKLPFVMRIVKMDMRPVQDEVEVLFVLEVGVK